MDTPLVTCGEYQLFLDDQLATGKNLQPDRWRSHCFLAGHGHHTLLGLRLSEEAIFSQDCAAIRTLNQDLEYYLNEAIACTNTLITEYYLDVARAIADLLTHVRDHDFALNLLSDAAQTFQRIHTHAVISMPTWSDYLREHLLLPGQGRVLVLMNVYV